MVWPCLKGPPKGWGEVRAGQVDIRLQADNSSLGPAVQGAVLCQLDQVSAVRTKTVSPPRRPGQQAPPGTPAPPPEGSSGIYESSVSWAASPSDKLLSPAFRRRPRKSRPDLGIHLRRKYAPNPAVDIDGAMGTPGNLRHLEIEPGPLHDPVAQNRIWAGMNMTRTWRSASPAQALADAHDGRLCGDGDESGRDRIPRGQYRGEGRFSAWTMASRRDISAFSSLYQEEITMA